MCEGFASPTPPDEVTPTRTKQKSPVYSGRTKQKGHAKKQQFATHNGHGKNTTLGNSLH